MKHIKITLLALVACALTACTKYQYLTIDSTLPQSEEGFVAINDSIKIAYRFEQDGVMEIEIRNLSKQMIYVDWAKSAVIQDRQSFTLANEYGLVNATAPLSDLPDSTYLADYEEYSSKASDLHFIPRDSYIRYRARPIPFETYDINTNPDVKKQTLNSFTIKSLDVDRIDADGFQTLLYVANEYDDSWSMYEHDFWVSKIRETQYDGSFTPGRELKYSELTAAGQVFTTIGGLALLTVYVIAEMDAEE